MLVFFECGEAGYWLDPIAMGLFDRVRQGRGAVASGCSAEVLVA